MQASMPCKNVFHALEWSHIILNIIIPREYPRHIIQRNLLEFIRICEAFYFLSAIGMRRSHAAIIRHLECATTATVALITMISENKCTSMFNHITSGRCTFPAIDAFEANAALASVARRCDEGSVEMMKAMLLRVQCGVLGPPPGCVVERTSPSDPAGGCDHFDGDVFKDACRRHELAAAAVMLCRRDAELERPSPRDLSDALCNAVSSRSDCMIRIILASLRGPFAECESEAYRDGIIVAAKGDNANAVKIIISAMQDLNKSTSRDLAMQVSCIHNSTRVAGSVIGDGWVETCPGRFLIDALIIGCMNGSTETLALIFSGERKISRLVPPTCIKAAIMGAVCRRNIDTMEWMLSQEGVITHELLLDIFSWFCRREDMSLARWFSRKHSIGVDASSSTDERLLVATVDLLASGEHRSTARAIDVDDPMEFM
jgi:hypothetical protein